MRECRRARLPTLEGHSAPGLLSETAEVEHQLLAEGQIEEVAEAKDERDEGKSKQLLLSGGDSGSNHFYKTEVFFLWDLP